MRRDRQPEWFATAKGGAPVSLTPAQILLLETMAKDGGKLPYQCAKILGIAQQTVNTQFERIGAKLGTEHWFATFLRFQEHRRNMERTP